MKWVECRDHATTNVDCGGGVGVECLPLELLMLLQTSKGLNKVRAAIDLRLLSLSLAGKMLVNSLRSFFLFFLFVFGPLLVGSTKMVCAEKYAHTCIIVCLAIVMLASLGYAHLHHIA